MVIAVDKFVFCDRFSPKFAIQQKGIMANNGRYPEFCELFIDDLAKTCGKNVSDSDISQCKHYVCIHDKGAWFLF